MEFGRRFPTARNAHLARRRKITGLLRFTTAKTPDRIKAGQSDAGVVWKTEVLEAHRAGSDVDAVSLPDEDSLRTDVAYVVGAMNASPHRKSADAFLSFLQSPQGQEAYSKFGFVKASEADLKLRPIN